MPSAFVLCSRVRRKREWHCALPTAKQTLCEMRGLLDRATRVFGGSLEQWQGDVTGGDGAVLRGRRLLVFRSEEQVSALTSYFELMDRMIPNFLQVLSPQTFRGTRILLR